MIYGGTGYIGSMLVNALVETNNVVANVSRKRIVNDNVVNYPYEGDVKSIISNFKPEKIIYLSSSFNNCDILDIVNVNIKKPLEILQYLESNSEIEFVYIGTYWQFGDSCNKNCPIDKYSASKKAIISFFDYYNNYTNVSCKEIVLHGTYGQSDKRGKLLDYLIDKVKVMEDIDITDGRQELNLVNVQSVCDAVFDIISNYKSKKIQIKSNLNYTPRSLIEILKSYSDVSVNFGAVEYRDIELMKLWDNPEYVPYIIEDEVEMFIKSKLN
jgi:nucleoside-diphosphate-sugar epimerase